MLGHHHWWLGRRPLPHLHPLRPRQLAAPQHPSRARAGAAQRRLLLLPRLHVGHHALQPRHGHGLDRLSRRRRHEVRLLPPFLYCVPETAYHAPPRTHPAHHAHFAHPAHTCTPCTPHPHTLHTRTQSCGLQLASIPQWPIHTPHPHTLRCQRHAMLCLPPLPPHMCRECVCLTRLRSPSYFLLTFCHHFLLSLAILLLLVLGRLQPSSLPLPSPNIHTHSVTPFAAPPSSVCPSAATPASSSWGARARRAAKGRSRCSSPARPAALPSSGRSRCASTSEEKRREEKRGTSRCVLCAVCCVLCAVCCVLCAVCCVLCAV